MHSRREQQALYFINISFSAFNNLLAILGIVFALTRLLKIAKKKRYVSAMGKKFGYETCKWKYIEKQLRVTLFLLILILEWLFITLYNLESVIRNAYRASLMGHDHELTNSCVLLNGTFLAYQYDTGGYQIAFNVAKGFQQALLVYGLWISFIFLTHICKALNKLVERKKLIRYSLLGGIGALIVLVISVIPVLSVLKFPINLLVQQSILILAIIKAMSYLSLFHRKNKDLELSYSYKSPYMHYRRWLLRQYFITFVSLAVLLQLYLLGDLFYTSYILSETVSKNPCWIRTTLNVQFTITAAIASVSGYFKVSILLSRLFKMLSNIGIFILQLYIIISYIYGKKKSRQKLTADIEYSLSKSLLSEED